jgi:hypothetical protein
VVLSAALVLAWQGATAPAVESAAPPPPAPLVAGTSSAPNGRRPVWIPATLGALHGGATALFMGAKIVVARCEGDDCYNKNWALSLTGELVPLVTTLALSTGTGLLGRHDARQDRKAELWRFRLAGGVLCGLGAVLGGAALSAVAVREFSVIELRLVSRTLWTTGLPLLTYAFGYRRAMLGRLGVAPVLDAQRVGLVLSGRF